MFLYNNNFLLVVKMECLFACLKYLNNLFLSISLSLYIVMFILTDSVKPADTEDMGLGFLDDLDDVKNDQVPTRQFKILIKQLIVFQFTVVTVCFYILTN
jgi:hypothetical protein